MNSTAEREATTRLAKQAIKFPRMEGNTARNPYWDYLMENVSHDSTFGDLIFGSEREEAPRYTPAMYEWEQDSLGRERINPNVLHREKLVRQYSWAIPSPGALQFIADKCAALKILDLVEIGAGTGYWANLIARQESYKGTTVMVRAYDKAPPNEHVNDFHTPRVKREYVLTQEDVDEQQREHEKWCDEMLKVANGVPDENEYRSLIEAARPKGKPGDVVDKLVFAKPDSEVFRNVMLSTHNFQELDTTLYEAMLLCWPPYDSPMAFDALSAFRGQYLFYIGEGAGGCTADDDFFDLLDEKWELVTICEDFYSWAGIRDNLHLYKRKEY